MKAQIACFCTAMGSRRLDHFLFVEQLQFSSHIKRVRRLGKDWERAVFVGLKRRGGQKKKKKEKKKEKNYLGASVFSDPDCNYKCIWEMSYLWRAVPQAGLFFPLSLWWVSRTCSDKADKKRGPLSGGSLGNYNSLFEALQRCCVDKGQYNEEERPAIMYPLNGSK